jgi:hypothetical protein
VHDAPVTRRLLLAAVSIAVLASAPAARAGEPSQTAPAPADNPCLQPELHLECPNLVMRRPSAFHLLRTRGGRQLLAATNAIVNVGDGPLELRATRVGKRTMRVRQVLRAQSGSTPVVLRGAGHVEYYDTRSRGVYWKYDLAARFELWRLDEAGNPTGLVRTGPKLHYCFRDLRRVLRLTDGLPYLASPRVAQFPACSQNRGINRVVLGTSVGWADIYPWSYPENWISVGGLSGCFLYVLRVDPENHFRELREDDNASDRVVHLPWKGDGRHGCPEPTRIPQVTSPQGTTPQPPA